jgi:hypothetical protein
MFETASFPKPISYTSLIFCHIKSDLIASRSFPANHHCTRTTHQCPCKRGDSTTPKFSEICHCNSSQKIRIHSFVLQFIKLPGNKKHKTGIWSLYHRRTAFTLAVHLTTAASSQTNCQYHMVRICFQTQVEADADEWLKLFA